MRIALREIARTGDLAQLEGKLPPQSRRVRVRYRTRTGALLRVDGAAAGAFDREHHDVVLEPSAADRTLRLDVELEALPTNGLPAGPGLIWFYLQAGARQSPARVVSVQRDGAVPIEGGTNGSLPVIGHSHLDVAWLWTYEQTRRKAERTFAIACDLLERDESFIFAQSQPQLYAFVGERDPELFTRTRAFVDRGRFDPDIAALWVESDCNLPSGESLMRQLLFANAYCTRELGVTPSIAWLPDSFGFANTIPTLLAHAGIAYFATTKLQWNDTNRFPYAQFIWEGPDGSAIPSALIASYDGGAYPWRVKTARERAEPLVAGFGDGGGGVTPGMLKNVARIGHWIRPAQWFAQLRPDELPRYRDELYLEYHRGVYTTHHDVKAGNALLERSLAEAEELVAWCIAVHAPRATLVPLIQGLEAAWTIVLRNQFHDVLPGTSIEAVYDDVRDEYAQAAELVGRVLAGAQAVLPRGAMPGAASGVTPRRDGDGFVLDNGIVAARVRGDGTIDDLRRAGGRNRAIAANVLALYGDRPKAWEAWNLDASYRRRGRPPRWTSAAATADAVHLSLIAGGSTGTMRVRLVAGEPFVRVDLDLDWRERRTILRVENTFAAGGSFATYGTPHGTIERSARCETSLDRARFEVPGQRFAFVREGNAGAAMLALDTYGWSARAAADSFELGHSLLRGTTWPDPAADLGEHRISYAFLPFADASVADIEDCWQRFAHAARVRLCVPENANVLVVACKPAHDGDGVIVRVRECDGVSGPVRIRCAARMQSADPVDGLERPASWGPIAIEAETACFDVPAFGLRAFRLRFP